MKARFLLFSLSALLAHAALADTTATVPVGFTTLTPAPSPDGTTRQFTVASFPLQGETKWAGTVISTPDATTLAGKDAAWGDFGPTAQGYPTHYVRVLSGTLAGKTFAIAQNTANNTTVVLPSTISSLAGSLVAGDAFEIVPANTFKSLFGANSTAVKLTQNAVQDLADIVYLWDAVAWVAYWFDGNQWINQYDEFSDCGDTPIFNDEAVWLARRSQGAISYTCVGTVPSSSGISMEVPGAAGPNRQFTLLSNPYPAETTLGTLQLEQLGNWQRDAVADLADIAYIWNGASWVAYWHNGSSWVSQYDEFSDAAGTSISLGAGIWVARRSGSGAGNSNFISLVRPYPLQ